MSVVQKGEVAVIPAGEALSGVIDLRDLWLVGLVMPAQWDAAELTFQAGADKGGPFNDLYDAAAEVSVAAGAGRHITLNPLLLAGARFLKIRSGGAGAPVNQAAERRIIPLVRSL